MILYLIQQIQIYCAPDLFLQLPNYKHGYDHAMLFSIPSLPIFLLFAKKKDLECLELYLNLHYWVLHLLKEALYIYLIYPQYESNFYETFVDMHRLI